MPECITTKQKLLIEAKREHAFYIKAEKWHRATILQRFIDHLTAMSDTYLTACIMENELRKIVG